MCRMPAVPSEPFRIVVVDPLPPKLRDLFAQQIPAAGFHFDCPEGSGRDELLTLVRGANALVTRHRWIDGQLISEARSTLRVIQVMGRLPDRVDLPAAGQAGVAVAVMPHGGAIAVAEHTMAMILALTRRVLAGHRGVVDGKYRDRNLEPATTTEWSFAFNWLGFKDVVELRAKTLGLLGLGEIGREVARRAQAFDMEIVYHQRHRILEPFERLLGVEKVDLAELLRRSDIVSLHVPHTPETDRMIHAEKLALMKPTAYLVNTCRGGVVDEADLVAALRERRIAGAALDVFAQEPLPAGHPLTQLDQVVLAPHTGGGSGGGQKKHFAEIVENLVRVSRRETPNHQVEEVLVVES